MLVLVELKVNHTVYGLSTTQSLAEDSLKERQHNWKCIVGLATLHCLFLWAAPNVCKLRPSTLRYLQHAISESSHNDETTHNDCGVESLGSKAIIVLCLTAPGQ